MHAWHCLSGSRTDVRFPCVSNHAHELITKTHRQALDTSGSSGEMKRILVDSGPRNSPPTPRLDPWTPAQANKQPSHVHIRHCVALLAIA
jgi:hypothetical protein